MSNQPILSPPIPTYEEAVAGSTRNGEEPEAVGLLARDSNYRPPRVDSARSSLDSLESLSDRGNSEDRRRDMQRLEVEDPLHQQSNASSAFLHISKRLANMKQSLSTRFSAFTPFRNVRLRMPQLPDFITNPAYTPLYRLLGIFIIMIIVYILMASDIFAYRRNPIIGANYDRDSMRVFIINNMKESNIKHFAQHMSSFDHLAGTAGDYTLARYVEGYFSSYLLDSVQFEKYEVYLNYPEALGRNVSIIGDKGKTEWVASLEEGKPKGAKGSQTYSFHALSKSGDVTGHLVYANDGADRDYEELKKLGVDLKGAIILVRASGRQSDAAWKVKAAQEAGAAGVLIFSDPGADDIIPDGGPRMDDYVQRDSVALQSHFVGDVLSQGFASVKDAKRISIKESPALPKIPSLPIPWKDAEHLLKAIKGKGHQMKDRSWHWDDHGMEWWTGDKSSSKIRLVNELKEMEKQNIWNVFGYIRGIEQSEKKIIIGNQRDSFCFGASDSVSGTAIMLEVARVFKELMEIGWRPMRTIVFASWDGGAYNNIGSTEYVEKNIADLRRNGFAYINLGAAVGGKTFTARGNPMFEDALAAVLSQVPDPETKKSLFKIAGGVTQIPPLGGAGDFTAFQSHAGVPSLDLAFEGSPIPKHSCYDTAAWMTEHVDKGYYYHKAMAQVVGLLLLELADTPILPFSMENYAARIADYVEDLKTFAEKNAKDPLDFHKLDKAVKNAIRFTREFERTSHRGWKNNHNYDTLEDAIHGVHRQSHNARMPNFEHHLLDLERGVPDREWFKSIMYAPEMRNAQKSSVFPAIRDSILLGRKDTQEVIDRCAQILDSASHKLMN